MVVFYRKAWQVLSHLQDVYVYVEDYKIAPFLPFFGAIIHHVSSQTSRGLLLFITKILETNKTKQYALINRTIFKDYIIVKKIH
jgi:hypothetical protein